MITNENASMATIAELFDLGVRCHQSGDARQAESLYRQILAVDPRHADAWHLLGVIAEQVGRHDVAVEYIGQALRLDPSLATAHFNLGNILRDQGHLEEAAASFQQALLLKPDYVEAYNNLGNLLYKQGRLAEAKASYEAALRLKPDYAEAHNNLGNVLEKQDQLEPALASYQEALRLKPDYAEAHNNLGKVLQEQGELAEAEAAFREALRLQPTYASPLPNLVFLLRDKLSDADRAALEARLADPNLGKGPHARLLFALAHVLDAEQNYAAAAEHLRQANALTLEVYRERREYSPTEHELFVDDVLRGFGADFCARTAGAGSPTRRPVFVFGLPRSGTTLIEQILASHSRIHGAGELRLAQQTFEAIPGVLGLSKSPFECLPNLDSAALCRLAQQHEERMQALAEGQADRIVDKMPDNYMYLGLLAALFPRAVFIHCRRDLRDVAVSCWMTDFRSILWANDPVHIATRFRQYRRLMDHWRMVLPVSIYEVDYEETVTDLEGVARRLIAACGLEWEPACLDYHRTERPIRTSSGTQVREPIYRRSVARWKNYERDLGELFEALAKV